VGNKWQIEKKARGGSPIFFRRRGKKWENIGKSR
jgi:hypothetical protein